MLPPVLHVPVLSLLSDVLCTFWVHSVLACATALVGSALLLERPQHRDLIWKSALLAPMATTLLAFAMERAGGVSIVVHTNALAMALRRLPFAMPPVRIARRVVLRGGTTNMSDAVHDPLLWWMVIAVSVVAIGSAAVAVWRHVRSVRRLERALAHRELDGQCTARVRALTTSRRQHRRLIVTTTEVLASPLAISRFEICVPAPLLQQLDDTQRESVLAHECAHAVRKDPEWTKLAAILSALCWCQPLMRAVVRRWRRDAEFICDEQAATVRGGAEALVGALARIAEHFDLESASMSMVGLSGSPVVERAQRLLAPRMTCVGRMIGRRLLLCAGIVVAPLLAPLLVGATLSGSHVVPEKRESLMVVGAPGQRLKLDTMVYITGR